MRRGRLLHKDFSGPSSDHKKESFEALVRRRVYLPLLPLRIDMPRYHFLFKTLITDIDFEAKRVARWEK